MGNIWGSNKWQADGELSPAPAVASDAYRLTAEEAVAFNLPENLGPPNFTPEPPGLAEARVELLRTTPRNAREQRPAKRRMLDDDYPASDRYRYVENAPDKRPADLWDRMERDLEAQTGSKVIEVRPDKKPRDGVMQPPWPVIHKLMKEVPLAPKRPNWDNLRKCEHFEKSCPNCDYSICWFISVLHAITGPPAIEYQGFRLFHALIEYRVAEANIQSAARRSFFSWGSKAPTRDYARYLTSQRTHAHQLLDGIREAIEPGNYTCPDAESISRVLIPGVLAPYPRSFWPYEGGDISEIFDAPALELMWRYGIRCTTAEIDIKKEEPWMQSVAFSFDIPADSDDPSGEEESHSIAAWRCQPHNKATGKAIYNVCDNGYVFQLARGRSETPLCDICFEYAQEKWASEVDGFELIYFGGFPFI